MTYCQQIYLLVFYINWLQLKEYQKDLEYRLQSGKFGFCLLSFPQNKRKIYKLRQLSWSQFVYFLQAEPSMITFTKESLSIFDIPGFKANFLVFQHLFGLALRCGIFGFCLLWFPQNERKIYKLRQLSQSQFVYFLKAEPSMIIFTKESLSIFDIPKFKANFLVFWHLYGLAF